jgi:hypothetical protein
MTFRTWETTRNGQEFRMNRRTFAQSQAAGLPISYLMNIKLSS